MSNQILKMSALVGLGLFLNFLIAAGDLSAASKGSGSNRSQSMQTTGGKGNKEPKTSSGTTAVQKTKPSKTSSKDKANKCAKKLGNCVASVCGMYPSGSRPIELYKDM